MTITDAAGKSLRESFLLESREEAGREESDTTTVEEAILTKIEKHEQPAEILVTEPLGYPRRIACSQRGRR